MVDRSTGEGVAAGRLAYLTADDDRLLGATGTRVRYSPGDVLVRAGQTVPGLFVVRKGRARLELNDRQGELVGDVIDPSRGSCSSGRAAPAGRGGSGAAVEPVQVARVKGERST